MQKSISFKNINISFSDLGKGQAIILLHGFLENKTMWKGVEKELSKRNRVIAIDLLGHGETDCLGYVHHLDIFSEAIEAVLKSLKFRRFYLIGHSLGGYIALTLANRNVAKVKGICLLNSTSNQDDQQRKALRLRANTMAQHNFENLIRMSFINLFRASIRKKFKSEINTALSEALHTKVQSYIAANEGMRTRKNQSQVLKKTSFKKLIIAGRKDPVLDIQKSIEEAKDTNTDIEILEGGHMSHIENSKDLIAILQNFVRG